MALNQYTKHLLTVLLTAIVVAGEGKQTGFPYPITQVYITNNLDKHENMQIHCKDKGDDFGVHQVPYGEIFNLEVVPVSGADYYCGFVFNNVLHWFDIYLWKRDADQCGLTCRWAIYEAGPCLLKPYACYQWNRDETIS